MSVLYKFHYGAYIVVSQGCILASCHLNQNTCILFALFFFGVVHFLSFWSYIRHAVIRSYVNWIMEQINRIWWQLDLAELNNLFVPYLTSFYSLKKTFVFRPFSDNFKIMFYTEAIRNLDTHFFCFLIRGRTFE